MTERERWGLAVAKRTVEGWASEGVLIWRKEENGDDEHEVDRVVFMIVFLLGFRSSEMKKIEN